MSNYVSCPACKGRGLIPLEQAEAIKAHVSVTADERTREAWEHSREMVRRDNELRADMLTKTSDQRLKAAAERLAALEAAASGQPPAAGNAGSGS
jgi:uncharacterized Zn finger protein (UPF0148 family)